jgi:hypothetical protein
MACDVLQLSLVAMGDYDPSESHQPFSFPFSSPTPLKNFVTLLPEVSMSKMVSGAFQLSLVALGDRDPLERHQSYSLSPPLLTPSTQ